MGDDLTRKLEDFMLKTAEHQGRVEKSFSSIAGSLQRQEGRMDRIEEHCTSLSSTAAGNMARITVLEADNVRQWDSIASKTKAGSCDDDNGNGTTKDVIQLQGFGAKIRANGAKVCRMVVVAVALVVIVIYMASLHVKLSGLQRAVAPEDDRNKSSNHTRAHPTMSRMP